MSALDLERLLAPIADDNPTGDDLEYDAEFMELERIAQGKPERVMGDEVLAAEDPDWDDVQARAEALLGRSKDLRVAVLLARGALATAGAEGLADGISLIAALLDRYWEGVHPRLDPEDDNDPTTRVNCLLQLADRVGFVTMVRNAPMVSSQVLGRFSYRDFLVASGEMQAAADAETEPPDAAQIEAAFRDASVESLTDTHAALDTALNGVDAIDATMNEQVGASYAPDLDPLRQTLRAIRDLLAQHLANRGADVAVAPVEAGTAAAEPVRRAAPGDVSSREDVVAMLERICQWYARNEPSSPVPLVLRRAQRLAQMDFMEILRDMTPSGVAEAEQIGGIHPDT